MHPNHQLHLAFRKALAGRLSIGRVARDTAKSIAIGAFPTRLWCIGELPGGIAAAARCWVGCRGRNGRRLRPRSRGGLLACREAYSNECGREVPPRSHGLTV